MPRFMSLAPLVALFGLAIANAAPAQVQRLKQVKEAAKNAVKPPARDSATADTRATASAVEADSAVAGRSSPPSVAASPVPQQPKPTAQVWENYDFVPGSKVLFYTDFSEDRVGNFARGLKYVSGPAEIVEREGIKVLRSTGPATFLIPVGRQLPARFTLEIDVLAPATALGGYDYVVVEGGAALDRSEKSAEINWHTHGSVIIGGGQTVATSEKQLPDEQGEQALGALTHLRILMDGAYFKMYANEKRIYNIPELEFKRGTEIRVMVRGGEEADQATFFTAVRLAESDTDVLYDALTTKGRWTTHGILFETGKSDLKPESRPVLKEIAAALKQHAGLKIQIEGHTDNVGTPASNLTLSDARAAAVKVALVSDFGIGADRITTKGLGDTKPAAPNTTPAGRAQNRRVEIVKQ